MVIIQLKLRYKNSKSKAKNKTEVPVLSESEDKKRKIQTMALSIREGYFGGLAQTLTDQFMTPYAISLNVSPTQMGILRSFLGFLSPIGQIIGSNRMKHRSRRSIVLKGIFFQLLMWPLIILLGFFALNDWFPSIIPFFLMTFYILYSFFGSTTGPSWFSLMGDIVPEDYRGRYFSKRSFFITGLSITLSVLASILLEQFRILDGVLFGYLIIFLVAFLSRGISWSYLARHYYPPFKIEKHSYLSFKNFVKKIPNSNFGLFTLYMTFITFSVNIGVPYMAYYMLEELSFNYIEYVAVNLSTPLISLAFFPLLGHLSDKYGNTLVLRICGFLLPSLPILWIFFNTPLQLILIPQLISAFAWTGMNLSASNFIYDNIPKQQRGFYIAYYNFFLGMGVLCGGLLGSVLLQIVPIIFISVYETLFLISGSCRLLFDFMFLFRIREVRVKNNKKN
ncbi:MAG: MFS transporter [Candidatus Lokiarchaeota archaeon]|nr:MFS transporter [Candidatus Lokiarchaeota archaeon]